MRGQGVGLARDAVDVELQADRLAGFAHALVNLGGTLWAAKFFFQVALAVNALGGQVGIELKRVPANDHIGQVIGLGQGQRGFEFAFADVAPGADHVGHDVDGEGGGVHGQIVRMAKIVRCVHRSTPASLTRPCARARSCRAVSLMA